MRLTRLSKVVFCFAFLVHAFSCLVNANGPIADWHSYRQSQTALTIRSYVENGWSLFYETPIVGQPWMIPMEFPLYQSIVYAVHCCFRGNLELECRVVSLLFFYASFVVGSRLLPVFLKGIERWLLYFIGAAVLASSYYLYWADAILIESTGLFLSLLSAWLLHLFFLYEGSAKYGVALMATTSFLALSKITTFIGVFAPFAALLGLSYLMNPIVRCNQKFRVVISLLIIVGVNYFLLNTWVEQCDLIKSENPLAKRWVSDNLVLWNFGTLNQRLNPLNWLTYFKGLGHYNFYFWSIAGGVAVWNSIRDRTLRVWNAGMLLIMLTGPLVFFNLYVVHTYYDIPNNWVLVALFVINGCAFIQSLESRVIIQRTVAGLWLVLFIYFAGYRRFMHTGYDAKFIDRHINKWEVLSEVGRELPDGPLLSFLEPQLNSVYCYHLRHDLIMMESDAAGHFVRDILERNRNEGVVGLILEPEKFYSWSMLDTLLIDKGWTHQMERGHYRLYTTPVGRE